ncbi:MAG: TraX protein [Oscillospiraceae bacterium]|nr:TraX protein [Oscillospiraceae bacterium]
MERLVPEKYRIFIGSALKTMAVVSMIIDHVAFVLVQRMAVGHTYILGSSLTLYSLMRCIGRLAFPIYCFLLVEGFVHTHDRRRYGLRLLSFAAISEIPWNLVHTGRLLYERQNVFFTLALGFIALCLAEGLEKDAEHRALYALGLAAVVAAGLWGRMDYGAVGVGIILMMYVLRERAVLRAAAGVCLLPNTWIAGLAFVPIALYNGKRGFIRSKTAQIAFYAVYPVHLLLLYFLRWHYFGY